MYFRNEIIFQDRPHIKLSVLYHFSSDRGKKNTNNNIKIGTLVSQHVFSSEKSLLWIIFNKIIACSTYSSVQAVF